MTIEEHVLAALNKAATKVLEPFPLLFAEHVFPDDFYEHLQHKLRHKEDYHSEKFWNRQFADEVGIPELEFMYKRPFFDGVLNVFREQVEAEFGGTNQKFSRDVRLIRDQQQYKIGPHTDAPWKVVSLLFYLPPDDSMRNFGTAIYKPVDPHFRCIGGPHHKFEDFVQVWRAPFIPNSCLGFWKTDRSFHGVPPIPDVVRRDVLLYNIYRDQNKLDHF